MAAAQDAGVSHGATGGAPQRAQTRTHSGSPSASSAWAGASTLGLLGTGTALCSIAVGRAICGISVYTTDSNIRRRVAFSKEESTPALDKQVRWCECHSNVDPVGRTGHRGALLDYKFCHACYTTPEVVQLRKELLGTVDTYPLVLWGLTLPLPVLALAPLLRRWPWLHQRAYVTAVCVNTLDFFINIAAMAFRLNSEVFRSLCFDGHVFSEKYRVEVIFNEGVYADVCAYSAQEHTASTVISIVIVLDVLVFAILAFMQTMREQGAYDVVARERRQVFSSLAKRARPVQSFDSRRNCSADRSSRRNMLGRVSARAVRHRQQTAGTSTQSRRAALGLDISLGLGFGRSRGAGQSNAHEKGEGLLSLRHDGRGRSLRNGSSDVVDADPLPETAAVPGDVDVLLDEGGDSDDELHCELAPLELTPLDPSWQRQHTETGREYYEHLETREVRWSMPQSAPQVLGQRHGSRTSSLPSALPSVPPIVDSDPAHQRGDASQKSVRRLPASPAEKKRKGLLGALPAPPAERPIPSMLPRPPDEFELGV
mmetsp:Transcript_116597/g.189863  ORF Transcript_116597/g.189863 Transcript_116597/m.189863 type:complete len:541 (-) Transcript_116597:9-1631(-)